MSIKTKLIVAVSFLLIAIIVAISYVTLRYFEAKTRELIADEQFAKVTLFANEFDDKLMSAHDQLIALSGSVPPDLLKKPEEARAFLNNRVELHKLFDKGLYLFSSSGMLIAEAPHVWSMEVEDFSFRDYIAITLATKKPYISDPFFSVQPHKHPVIMFTAPLFDPKVGLSGVLGGSIDLLQDNIFSSLISMQIGKTGYFYIVTRDRRILLHPVRDRILQQDVPVGLNVLFDRAMEGFEGSGETVTSRGLHAFTSFKHMKVKNWLVAANFPIAEAYAPIYRAQKRLLIVMAVTILLVPGFVWYLMNWLTNPLLAFTRHVKSIPEKLGEGRFFPVTSSDEIGKLTEAFNKMVADVDRHQAEIEAQREKLSVTLASIADGVMVTDAQGTLIRMNRVAEKLTGRLQEEALSLPLQKVFNVVDEKSREPVPEPVTKVIAGGEIEDIPLDAVLLSQDGAEYFISGNCAPIRDAEGRTIGTVLVFQDITERKKAEEEVTNLLGEIGKFNQEMETLLSERTMNLMALTVADRVRNPSSCIAVACRRLLAKGDVTDRQKDSIEIIADSASKLEAIVNDFQALLKSKESMFTYEDLNKIVEGVLSVIKREADTKGIEMIVSLRETPLRINTNMNLLRIAVFHVIKNAIEVTPRKGTLTVSTLGEADGITLVISDTGPGIPNGIIDNIFDPFFTTKERSFGMGLPLVKQIVSEHMGEINVESDEGRGTTFRIVFPARWKERSP